MCSCKKLMGAIVTIKARVQSRSESLSIEVVSVCQCPKLASSDILWQHKVLDLTPNILPALRFAHFRQLEIKFQDTMLGKLILSSPLRLLRKMALLPKKLLLCHSSWNSSGTLFPDQNPRVDRNSSGSAPRFGWLFAECFLQRYRASQRHRPQSPCISDDYTPSDSRGRCPRSAGPSSSHSGSSGRGCSGGSYHCGSGRPRCGGGGGTRCHASTACRARFPTQRSTC